MLSRWLFALGAAFFDLRDGRREAKNIKLGVK
jgi:hypothetical protein